MKQKLSLAGLRMARGSILVPPRQVKKSRVDAEELAMNKVNEEALQLFVSEGQDSPRWQELHADDCDPTPEEWHIQRQTFCKGSRSPKAVRATMRVAKCFIDDARLFGWNPWSLTGLRAAAWIRRFLTVRQKPDFTSLATKVVAAYRWLHSGFGQELDIKHPMITALCSKTSTHLVAERPVHAVAPSVDMAMGLEYQINAMYSVPLRVYAGMATASIHGTKRFADVQRTRSFTLTESTGIFESQLKNQEHWTRWAVPRVGFSQTDWVMDFTVALVAAELPGVDFITWGLSQDGLSFANSVATVGDGERALHMLLRAPPHNLAAEVACQFTWHGLRRLQLTCAIQLQSVGVPIPDAAIEDIGTWKKGSTVIDGYNDAMCSRQLVLREQVVSAVQQNWRPVEDGAIPGPAPGTPAPFLRETAPAPQVANEVHQPAGAMSGKMSSVVNTASGRWHLFPVGGLESFCRNFACGSMAVPHRDAYFFEGDDPSGYTPCGSCVKGLRR